MKMSDKAKWIAIHVENPEYRRTHLIDLEQVEWVERSEGGGITLFLKSGLMKTIMPAFGPKDKWLVTLWEYLQTHTGLMIVEEEIPTERS